MCYKIFTDHACGHTTKAMQVCPDAVARRAFCNDQDTTVQSLVDQGDCAACLADAGDGMSVSASAIGEQGLVIGDMLMVM